jgi:serine/threonine protein kinase/tetratricopeptide (TPR) repeat protein
MNAPICDVERLFHMALERAEPERTAFLDEECGDNAALRQRVDDLLRSDSQAGTFLQLVSHEPNTEPAEPHTGDLPTLPHPPATEPAPEALPATSLVGETRCTSAAAVDGPGSVIGPYTLLHEIGRGGMGTVFEAQQEGPMRRRVALKIIKPGTTTDLVVERFKAERQALALMSHPGIASVFDAGSASNGLPYFAMELVIGVPLNEYCDQSRLDLRRRLELFVDVCRAIQHAHQKGVIHRDIKPSNILVTRVDGKPLPKVIDFGVAKAIGSAFGGLTERSLHEQSALIVGTLAYMSPEQTDPRVLDIDTRSDVYSLGCVLYELLTGVAPLPIATVGERRQIAIIRMIREDQPQKPSARLGASQEARSSIAAQRGLDPERLRKLVRGDLDWIVMKALEKDRSRRYDSVDGLARDIERHLAGDPVEAGPSSATYRLRKLARKHRRALAFSGALVGSLILGAAISIWQAIRATRGEAKARRSEAEAHAVLAFVLDKVLAAPRPRGQEGGQGLDVTVERALSAAEEDIASVFARQPLTEAAVRDALGKTYLFRGDTTKAIRQYERAAAIRTALLGPRHADSLSSTNDLGVAYRLAGRADDAIRVLRQVCFLREAELGRNHPDTLAAMGNLAVAYQAAGRTAEAIALHEEELARSRATLGADHPDTLASMSNLAAAYQAVGRAAEAVPLFESALELYRKKLGPDHPETLTSRNNLAAAYQLSGRTDEAITMLEDVLATQRANLGLDHPDTLSSQNNLALVYQETGRIDAALAMFEDVLKRRKAKLGPDHPDTLTSMNHLAEVYLEQERWSDAEILLRDCLDRRVRREREEWRRFHTMSQLGASLAGQKKYAEAEPLLVEGFEGMKKANVPAHRKKDFTTAAARIVTFYERSGNPEKAAIWRERLAPIMGEVRPKP